MMFSLLNMISVRTYLANISTRCSFSSSKLKNYRLLRLTKNLLRTIKQL